jgi:hypothetical protein
MGILWKVDRQPGLAVEGGAVSVMSGPPLAACMFGPKGELRMSLQLIGEGARPPGSALADASAAGDDAARPLLTEAGQATGVASKAAAQARELELHIAELQRDTKAALLRDDYGEASERLTAAQAKLAALGRQVADARNLALERRQDAITAQQRAYRASLSQGLAHANERVEAALAKLCADEGGILSELGEALADRAAFMNAIGCQP